MYLDYRKLVPLPAANASQSEWEEFGRRIDEAKRWNRVRLQGEAAILFVGSVILLGLVAWMAWSL